jgi:hypothetical protein
MGVNKMNKKNEFTKALRLLDAQKDSDAINILKSILEESIQSNDNEYIVRSSCVLSEYFFINQNFEFARKYIDYYSKLELDSDEEDMLEYEINRIKEITLELDKNK